MLELLCNTLQRTEQDCTALVEKLGKNATCLKVQANLDLRGTNFFFSSIATKIIKSKPSSFALS